MDNTYKLFQLSELFVNKYGYQQIIISEYKNLSTNEIWLLNIEHPSYQLIRISFDDALHADKDEHIQLYLDYFKLKRNLDLKLLDVHINTDAYNKDDEKYDHINIDDNYYQGIDLHEIYPDIYIAIHTVSDSTKEVNSIVERMYKAAKKRRKKLPLKLMFPNYVTYIFMLICILNFIVGLFLKSKYDSSSVFVFLGAEYKTFTLGLKQFYRLFTYAFVHNDFLHLLCNMVSLFSIGQYVENKLGHLKYALILSFSIIIGGLTQGILSDNTICMGISGGIYGLLVVFIIEAYKDKVLNLRVFFPTLMINLFLNFMSNVAWLAHLGGAIGGFAIYYYLQDYKRFERLALCIVLLLCLVIKYVTIDSIKSIYAGTDFEVVNMFNDLGFKNHAQKLLAKLLQAYEKYGG